MSNYEAIATEAGRDHFRSEIERLLEASGRNQDEVAQAMADHIQELPSARPIKWESLRDQLSKFKRGEGQARRWFAREVERLEPLAKALKLGDTGPLQEAYRRALEGRVEETGEWHPCFPGVHLELPAPVMGQERANFVDRFSTRLAAWVRDREAGRGANRLPPWVWVDGAPGTGRRTLGRQLAQDLTEAVGAKLEDGSVVEVEFVDEGNGPPDRVDRPRVVVGDPSGERRDLQDEVVRPALWGADEVEALLHALAEQSTKHSDRLARLQPKAGEIVAKLGRARRPPQVIRFIADVLDGGLPDSEQDARRLVQDGAWKEAKAREPGLGSLGPEWIATFWLHRVRTAGIAGAWMMSEREVLDAIQSTERDADAATLGGRQQALWDLKESQRASAKRQKELVKKVEAWLAGVPSSQRLPQLLRAGLLRQVGEEFVAGDEGVALSWAADRAAAMGELGLDADAAWCSPMLGAWIRELAVWGQGKLVLKALREAPAAASMEVAEARVELAARGVFLPDEELIAAWATVLAATARQSLLPWLSWSRDQARRRALQAVSERERGRLPDLRGDRWEAVWSLVPDDARALLLGWEPDLHDVMEGSAQVPTPRERPTADDARWSIGVLASWQCPPRGVEEWARRRGVLPKLDAAVMWRAEGHDEACQLIVAGWDPETDGPFHVPAHNELPIRERLRWLDKVPDATTVVDRLMEVVDAEESLRNICVEVAMSALNEGRRRALVRNLLHPMSLLDRRHPEAADSGLPRRVHFGLELAEHMADEDVLRAVVANMPRALASGRFHTDAQGTVWFDVGDEFPVPVGITRDRSLRELVTELSSIPGRVLGSLAEAARLAAAALDGSGEVGARAQLLTDALGWSAGAELARSWQVVVVAEGLRTQGAVDLVVPGPEVIVLGDSGRTQQVVDRLDGGPEALPRREDLGAARASGPTPSSGLLGTPRALSEFRTLVEHGLDPAWEMVGEVVEALCHDSRRAVSDELLAWLTRRSQLPPSRIGNVEGALGDVRRWLVSRLESELVREGSDVPIRLRMDHGADVVALVQGQERALRVAFELAEDIDQRMALLVEASRLPALPRWARRAAEAHWAEHHTLPTRFRPDAALLKHMLAGRPLDAGRVLELHRLEPCCGEVQELVRTWLESATPLVRSASDLDLDDMLTMVLDLARLEDPPEWLPGGLASLWRDHVVRLDASTLDGGRRLGGYGWLDELLWAIDCLGLQQLLVEAWDAAPEGSRAALRDVVATAWAAQASQEELESVDRSEEASEWQRQQARQRLPALQGSDAGDAEPPDLAEAPWAQPQAWDRWTWRAAGQRALDADRDGALEVMEAGLRQVPVEELFRLEGALAERPDERARMNLLLRQLWMGRKS